MSIRRALIWPSLLTVAVLALALPLPASMSADPVPPLPEPLPATGNCYDANIFFGAIPPGRENGSVLVFVHGLSGLAEDWWSDNTVAGLNDMYLAAYEAGYRTAFVNLNVDLTQSSDCSVVRRPANGMVDSAFVLGRQVNTILEHYGVDQIDIVAHSKGGVDTQAAVIWSGISPHVRSVFTLASPHQGSILIDLFWSPEGVWLGALLGQLDDASYSLRTGVMSVFRMTADIDPTDDFVRYYSAAGTNWQTPDTIFELSGQWLQEQPQGGVNDGVVALVSTYLPSAETLFIEPWNHYECYLGRNAFPYIDQVLRKYTTIYMPLVNQAGSTEPASADAVSVRHAGVPAAPAAQNSIATASNTILRGGLLNGAQAERFPIEPQARSVTFTLLTSARGVSAALSAPDGSTHPLTLAAPDSPGLLGGVSAATHRVDDPIPGEWTLRMDGGAQVGYLLIITVDSDLRVRLDGLPHGPISPNEPLRLTAEGRASEGDVQVREIAVSTVRALPGAEMSLTTRSGAEGSASLNYSFSHQDIYGMSIAVTGQTADGMSFERSFVHSQAVISAEKLADEAGVRALLSRK